MKRLILSILALFAAITAVVAQDDVTFEVAAPTAVEAGELFRIEFVINADPSDFTPPSIEGFEVMAGPSRSRSTNVSLVNGDFTRTETTTLTYVLQGFTEGLHTISAATATVKGRDYSTRPVTIEVVAGGVSSAGAVAGQTGASGSQSTQGAPAGEEGDASRIAADDVFIRAEVNRTEVYKGEPIVVTLKLYSRVQFNYNNDLRLPAFNGFWQQDISPADVNATQGRETSGGRVYNVWTLKEYLLYPQQAGALSVEPFDMSVNVLFQSRNTSPRNIFDELMGGGPAWDQIRKPLASAPVRIDVREWPGGAPDSFEGAVGDFGLDVTPPASAMNANTSGTYTLRLSGTGNFPLIRAPHLTLPDSFEQYNVTTSDNTRNTRRGTSGYREFSYPFIPRADGLYTIPALKFSYFDPRRAQYVTLSSHETSIEVTADTTAMATPAGGIVSGLSRDELKIFGQDIRFIKRGRANLAPKGKTFLWSGLFFALAGLAIALFAGGYAVLGRFVRNMQNDRFVRGKRANKVALKRFRAAEASMKQGDRHGFYDEMLKALWGYMSDKLDIPQAELSKERVREELFERNVPEGRGDEYARIISECEEAQYSPSPSARMGELYREGVDLVSELESIIKRSK